MNHIAKLSIALLGLIIIVTPVTAKLYRWVDEAGRVHYTDTLPPSQAERARRELNDRGREVERVERAKTAEERAKEQELARLRAEQKRLIEQQQAADRVLLKTFRSEDDIILARNGKLAAIDVMIQIANSNLKQIKGQLVEMQNSAANQERSGKKITKNLLDEISSSRQQLKDRYASIIKLEKDKERIRVRAQADLNRFMVLKKLQKDQKRAVTLTKMVDLVDYVAACPDQTTCDAYWKLATEYTLKHATTKLKIIGDSIILTAPAVTDKDISITLSRITSRKTPGAHLFFDLQCKYSPIGKEFCKSPEVARIRSGFRKSLLAEQGARYQ